MEQTSYVHWFTKFCNISIYLYTSILKHLPAQKDVEGHKEKIYLTFNMLSIFNWTHLTLIEFDIQIPIFLCVQTVQTVHWLVLWLLNDNISQQKI